MLRKKAPPCLLDHRFRNQCMCSPPHANIIVAAPLSFSGGRIRRITAGTTRPTKIGIAFPVGGEARTRIRAALSRLALAAAEKVRTLVSVPAVLGAEEAVPDATADVVVTGFVMIAGDEFRMDDLALNVSKPVLVVIFHRRVGAISVPASVSFPHWLYNVKFVGG